MKKYIIILLFIVPAMNAQTPGETILQSYERIFVRSNLSTKVNVLSDAAHDEAAAGFYGPLCGIALDFVITNAVLFRDDPDMLSLAVAAVRGVGKYAFDPAAESLWQVFLRFPDNVIRYEILEVLPVLDTRSLTGKITEFLAEQNRLSNSGLPVDLELLSPLFTILGTTGEESSYPVLFESSQLFSGEPKDQAVKALYEINGDLLGFLIKVILENPPPEKLSAFTLALSWDKLSSEKKGELAEAALEVALAVSGERWSETEELAGAALLLIRVNEWVRAIPLVFKYYNQSLAAFRTDLSSKQPLISAINCLGNLKSADTAQTLALQLGLWNSRSAALEKEEEEVVLALINALGQLGYKASYDGLLYTSMLPYPDEITEAARNALDKLKW